MIIVSITKHVDPTFRYEKCTSNISTSFCALLFTRSYEENIWNRILINVREDIVFLAFANWFLRCNIHVVNVTCLKTFYEKVSDRARLLNAVKALCETNKDGYDRVLRLVRICQRVLRTRKDCDDDDDDDDDTFDDIEERAKIALFVKLCDVTVKEPVSEYGRNSYLLHRIVAELELEEKNVSKRHGNSSSPPKRDLFEIARDKTLKPLEKFYQAFEFLDKQKIAIERISICIKRWKNEDNCDMLKRVVLDLENMKNDSKRNEIARTIWDRELMPFLRLKKKKKKSLGIVLRICGRLFELRGLSTSPPALRVRVWEALIAKGDVTTSPAYYFFEDERDDVFRVQENVLLSKQLHDRRMKLIENLVRRCRNSKSVESVVCLASDLKLSGDIVRVEATVSMYCRGFDEEAEIQFELVRDDLKKEMCERLVPLARSRLRALFRICLSSAKHSSILSAVDSHVSKKIMQYEVSQNKNMKEVNMTTLDMTRSLLQRLEIVLKDDEWIVDMSRAANDAFKAATSRSLVLDTSRRRPRTGTKMFHRKKETKKKMFPGLVPDLAGVEDNGGDWV